ncbi:MAG: ABC-2 family transporter protein, partial [Firmicutes bacterium]|nr:ABC-2 family transporter protein [Bacillota bacterium]
FRISIGWILEFIIVIVGGVLIYSSIWILFGAFSFLITKTGGVFEIIYQLRKLIGYPVSIYNQFIQILITFILPFAFINYYPSLLFLNKPGESLFSDSFKWGTIVVGIIWFGLSYSIFNLIMRRYKSTGS